MNNFYIVLPLFHINFFCFGFLLMFWKLYHLKGCFLKYKKDAECFENLLMMNWKRTQYPLTYRKFLIINSNVDMRRRYQANPHSCYYRFSKWKKNETLIKHEFNVNRSFSFFNSNERKYACWVHEKMKKTKFTR